MLKKSYIRLNERDALSIIKEYDADEDGTLNYDEFCMIVLPSTNPTLRNIAERRRDSYRFKADEPLTQSVEQKLCALFEKEINYLKKREEIKRQLLATEDFDKNKSFKEISLDREDISLYALRYFLEKNGFNAQREDFEAILRRCDHDANQRISEPEFHEITSSNPDKAGIDDVEEKAYESEIKKDLEKSVEKSPPRKAISITDEVGEDLEETVDRLESPKKDSKSKEELKKNDDVKKRLRFEDEGKLGKGDSKAQAAEEEESDELSED